MEKYTCNTCGYVYDPVVGDPDSGIEAGIPFGALPDDWVCPQCATQKTDFEPESGEEMTLPLAGE
jgi:rubredoxin